MSQVHRDFCFSFNLNSTSFLPSHRSKHHHHHHHHHRHSPLHLTASHTPFLSPRIFTPLRRINNSSVFLQASFEPISVDQKNSPQYGSLISAADVVRNFYGGINHRDLAAVESLIAQNCVYEDLIFPRPFVGRKSILEFFGKFINYISTDLQFVIDAISEEDSAAVGVMWHLEWKGRPFPFSKGCSFYQLEVVNGVRQIIYARDSVEPTIKPGESALIAIRGVLWLLQRFPKLEERL